MNRQLKRTAKEALRGSWGKAVALCILPVAVTLFVSLLESLLSIVTGYPLPDELVEGGLQELLGISPWSVAIAFGGVFVCFILLTPLRIGIKRWYFRMLGKGEEHQSEQPAVPVEREPLPENETGDTIVFEPVKQGAEATQEAFRTPDGFSIDELFSNNDVEPQAENEPDKPENAAAPELPGSMEETAAEEYSGSLGEAFDLFARARDYFGALWLRIEITLRSLCWLLLFSLPGAALLGVQLWLLGVFENGVLAADIERIADEQYLALLPSVGLVVFGWLLCSVFLLRYFAVEYIWSDARGRERIGSRRAIKLSVAAMKDNRLRLVGGTLSFLGWWLLCIFLVPTLYVQPYFEAYKAAFVREALRRE